MIKKKGDKKKEEEKIREIIWMGLRKELMEY